MSGARTPVQLRNDIRRLSVLYCDAEDSEIKKAAGALLDADLDQLRTSLRNIHEFLDKNSTGPRAERSARQKDAHTIQSELDELNGKKAPSMCVAGSGEQPMVIRDVHDEIAKRRSLLDYSGERRTKGEDQVPVRVDNLKSAAENRSKLYEAEERLHGLLLDELAALDLVAAAQPAASESMSQKIAGMKTRIQADLGPDRLPIRGAYTSKATSFYPARYVRIFENNYKEKVLLYDPRYDFKAGTTQLNADAGSELIIEVDPSLMGEEIALNRLIMSGTLSHGTAGGQNQKQQDIQIYGYSEIAKDPQSSASQNAVAFRTAETIQATLVNMYYTTKDILEYVYGKPCADKLAQNPHADCYVPADIDPQQVVDRLRLYKPEVYAISDFFNNATNANLADILGAEVFGIDPGSLKLIATQYKDNLDTLLKSAITDTASVNARTDLLERTKLIWNDFHSLREQMDNMMRLLDANPALRSACPEAQTAFIALGHVPPDAASACWIRTEWRDKVRNKLKTKLVPGTISLAQYDPQDGDVIMLRVEARESGGTVIGNPAIFQITLKYYDWRFRVSPSLLFVHRQNTSFEDLKKHPSITRVNFAPAPGVTAAITLHSRRVQPRGEYNRVSPTRRGSAMDFLSPGLGFNVSFLSFENQDYDPTTGTFSKTQSTGVQIGAGLVGSLFSNMLQFTYGWNLNTTAPRSYIGVGFGFIEVGKAIKGVVTGGNKGGGAPPSGGSGQ